MTVLNQEKNFIAEDSERAWGYLLCAILLAFTGCSPSPAPSSPVFKPSAWGGDPLVVASSIEYHKPGSIKAADLDRDGDLDLAAVGPDRLLWFEQKNESEISFCAHAIDQQGCANGLLIHDMDEDGFPDMVSAGGGPPDGRTMPGMLYWWQNPGDARDPWRRKILDPAPGNFLHDILACDLDNDGVLEIVAPRGASYIHDCDHRYDGLMVYAKDKNDGKGTWQRIELHSQNGKIRPLDFGLAAGDIDGDGYCDIFQFQTLWLNPKGRLDQCWIGRSWSKDCYPSNLVVYDMDGDRDLDLVFSEGHSHRRGSSRVGIWFNQTEENGAVQGHVEILGQVEQDPENLAVADLDQNNIPDIVTGAMNWRQWPATIDRPSWNDNDGTLVVFAGQAVHGKRRTFNRYGLRDRNAALHHLSLADMDQDGDLDVVGENAGVEPPPARTTPAVQIFWNDPKQD